VFCLPIKATKPNNFGPRISSSAPALANPAHFGYDFAPARTGHFTTIDFPGALFTRAFAISPRGDIVGEYQSLDGRNHGFLISRGENEGRSDDYE
jgi:hypothetical protein